MFPNLTQSPEGAVRIWDSGTVVHVFATPGRGAAVENRSKQKLEPDRLARFPSVSGGSGCHWHGVNLAVSSLHNCSDGVQSLTVSMRSTLMQMDNRKGRRHLSAPLICLARNKEGTGKPTTSTASGRASGCAQCNQSTVYHASWS